MPHALVVDDHPETLEALGALVEQEGFTVATAPTVAQAREELTGRRPDVVLIDLNLPDGSGMTLLDALEGLSAPSVVLITGHASLDTAVEAVRRGVTDYLTKPLDLDRLRAILHDITRTRELPREIEELSRTHEQTGRFLHIVGASAPMVRLCRLVARVAPTGASVLISGESGAGKDVVARTIHDLSRRRHAAFLPVNCGAITPSLMESELFGHERGSFTGADRRHRGCFERATRGTLFLDEITEMPLELQVKLLRVLETGTITRVGGEEPIAVDVRILAATNRGLADALSQGRLREDLYYRLKVFQLEIPPLRDRPRDVEPLVHHFLDELHRSEGAKKRISPAALELMTAYRWPGNVRELRNVVHSAYILSGGLIDVPSLPSEVRANTPIADLDGDVVRIPIGTTIQESERRMILATLKHYDGNKTRTAEVLGISLKTLYNRLHSYEDAAAGADGEEEREAKVEEI